MSCFEEINSSYNIQFIGFKLFKDDFILKLNCQIIAYVLSSGENQKGTEKNTHTSRISKDHKNTFLDLSYLFYFFVQKFE